MISGAVPTRARSEIMPHYREKDSSESETPPAALDPAPGTPKNQGRSPDDPHDRRTSTMTTRLARTPPKRLPLIGVPM